MHRTRVPPLFLWLFSLPPLWPPPLPVLLLPPPLIPALPCCLPPPRSRQWSDLEPGSQRPSRAAHYRGWEASRQAIEAALAEHAPIDGLLGFSQGATAAALFLAGAHPAEGEAADGAAERQQQMEQQQQQQQQQQQPASEQQQERLGGAAATLRFGVVIAGFLPRDVAYAAALRTGRPTLPALHVVGQADVLVPEERSTALWECWQEPEAVRVFRHPGAHMVRLTGGRGRTFCQHSPRGRSC